MKRHSKIHLNVSKKNAVGRQGRKTKTMDFTQHPMETVHNVWIGAITIQIASLLHVDLRIVPGGQTISVTM